MLPSTLASSVLLLASSVMVNAAGYATREPQVPSCQDFETSSNDTRPMESRDVIISTGVVCNVDGSNYSTPCDVLSGGWLTLQSIYLDANNSVIRGDATNIGVQSALGWTVWNSTGDSKAFYSSQSVAAENQTITFDNGTSGDGELWCATHADISLSLTLVFHLVVFTPTYRCVTGRIQGCPANFSLANETEISACYPELTGQVISFESFSGHFENISVVAGSRSINETSAEAAANLKQNPNNRPPYGLSSSDAIAGVRLSGVGVSSALALVVVWLGIYVL